MLDNSLPVFLNFTLLGMHTHFAAICFRMTAGKLFRSMMHLLAMMEMIMMVILLSQRLIF